MEHYQAYLRNVLFQGEPLPDTDKVVLPQPEGGAEVVPAVPHVAEEGELLPAGAQVVLQDLALAQVLGGQLTRLLGEMSGQSQTGLGSGLGSELGSVRRSTLGRRRREGLQKSITPRPKCPDQQHNWSLLLHLRFLD